MQISNFKENCIFCNMLSNNTSNYTFITNMSVGSLYLNKKQHYKGRCIYILNKHIENYHDISDSDLISCNKDIKLIGNVLFALFSANLINYALLGNHVQHVHWHIIPRYTTDGKWGEPPWPPVSEAEVSIEDALLLVNSIKAAIINSKGVI